MSEKFHIGIVAPSSQVPKIELRMGIEKIRQEGFSVEVHAQCKKSFRFFAGTDEERAAAFLEYAENPKFQVIWCARGGYGSIRLLSRLPRTSGGFGQKLLIGYSDSTALMEFVRREWGWSTLHAPMPSLRKFSILPESDWRVTAKWIRGEFATAPWSNLKLKYWTSPPLSPIQAPLVGGNLTVWNSMLGTPFQSSAEGCILFLEDVDENLYRVDRVLQQLVLSGSLDRVRAIVLGNFLNCRDSAGQVLQAAPTARNRLRVLKAPKGSELQPLRKIMKEGPLLKEIFSELGNRLRIPIAFGLPVGHGPEVSPLPLGAEYRLTPEGRLELLKWDWLK